MLATVAILQGKSTTIFGRARFLDRGGGQSHFAPKTPQTWDSPQARRRGGSGFVGTIFPTREWRPVFGRVRPRGRAKPQAMQLRLHGEFASQLGWLGWSAASPAGIGGSQSVDPSHPIGAQEKSRRLRVTTLPAALREISVEAELLSAIRDDEPRRGRPIPERTTQRWSVRE